MALIPYYTIKHKLGGSMKGGFVGQTPRVEDASLLGQYSRLAATGQFVFGSRSS